jgi:hypothetical protein
MNELMEYILSLTPEKVEKILENLDKIKAALNEGEEADA